MIGDKERRGGGIREGVKIRQTNISSEERRRAKEGGKGGKERGEQRISVYQFYYCVFIHE